MSALRIGEVARRVGTTPRTIRYYEEIGLLGGGERAAGAHRSYGEDEIEQLRDALRLKSLLGLSLEELKALTEAEVARAARREEWLHADPDAARRREILLAGLEHVDRQLALVQRRRGELDALADDLRARRERLLGHLDALGDG